MEEKHFLMEVYFFLPKSGNKFGRNSPISNILKNML
jgi:hypothetical protein